MKASKTLTSLVAAAAVAGSIGLAYAQTTTPDTRHHNAISQPHSAFDDGQSGYDYDDYIKRDANDD